jgi:hypothetical protein
MQSKPVHRVEKFVQNFFAANNFLAQNFFSIHKKKRHI